MQNAFAPDGQLSMVKKLFTKMQRQVRSFNAVLSLLWGASPRAIIVLILASSLTGLLTPLGLFCAQNFLDAIVLTVSEKGQFAAVIVWLLCSGKRPRQW